MVIDIPDSDDAENPDRGILRSLSTWLEPLHWSRKKLTEILYLQSISDPCMQGNALLNLHIFECLL